MVWEAYQKVRSNKGSAGIDAVSMQEFDANRIENLYKLWNRMASGSYFPPPVKEVAIAKKDGSIRKLGIPTISTSKNGIGRIRITSTKDKNCLLPRLQKKRKAPISQI